MKTKKQAYEQVSRSYLVDVDTFTDLGEPLHVPGIVSPERCKELAKRNHKMCEGRGVLNFDDGKVFFDANGNRHVLKKWRRSCDCVSRKLENNFNLIG